MKPFLSLLVPVLCFLGVVTYSFSFKTIEPSAAQAGRRAANLKFKTFVIPNEFSISYPAGWFISHSTNSDAIPRELVVITSLKPPKTGSHAFPENLIKTDIQINPGSFEENLDNITFSSLGADGNSKITGKGRTVIGGQEAYRVWISDPEAKAINTIVRYTQDETVSIISFYTDKNPAAIPLVQRIQGSFRIQ